MKILDVLPLGLSRDRQLEDFRLMVTEYEWRFYYEPLGFQTGSISRKKVAEMQLRLGGRFALEEWLEAEIRRACDVDPLRVMQIAQVGP